MIRYQYQLQNLHNHQIENEIERLVEIQMNVKNRIYAPTFENHFNQIWFSFGKSKILLFVFPKEIIETSETTTSSSILYMRMCVCEKVFLEQYS